MRTTSRRDPLSSPTSSPVSSPTSSPTLTPTSRAAAPDRASIGGRWVLILLALLLTAGAALAVVGDGEKGGDRPDFLPPLGYLDLDEAQAEVARELVRGVFEANAPLRQESRELMRGLRDQLNAEPQDAAAIGEAAIELHAVREQIRATREAANAEFEAVLDEEQLVKWRNFLELRSLLR